MFVLKIMFVFLACLMMSACRSGDRGNYYNNDYETTRGGFNFISFNVLDTYDVDSRSSNLKQVLDPFNSDGTFQAFWAISTAQHYEARLFINTAPVTSGRRVFAYAYCGGNDYKVCGLTEGTFYCSMSKAGYLVCEDGLGGQYIDDWLRNSSRYYLGLEICSTQGYGCSTRYKEVTVY
ncbi:MAG: hypothetical protein RL497_1138 [Pseudomonadota bacterium]|jgi:hypothetical protein